MQTFTRESDTFLRGEGLSHWEPNSSPAVRKQKFETTKSKNK